MESKITKIAAYTFALGLILWLGGVFLRAVISNELLQAGTLEFKPNINPNAERIIYSLIANASSVVLTGYILTWISGVVFLITTSFSPKEHGWLLMSAVFLYFLTPVEVYTIILDVKMMLLNFYGSNDLVEYRKLLIHRLGALSGVPFIAILCYLTMLGCIIFQPLRKLKEEVFETNGEQENY
ncbi:MAG: hypothetical protein AAB071_03260 [Bacteroidota bacterium]